MTDLTADWVVDLQGPSRALLFEGPAGIGKTHALTEIVDATAAAGARVLRAQPAAAELHLVGSALLDLCTNVSEAEIAQLPPAQARALSAALLRGEAAPAQPHAVALAFTTLLGTLSAAGPVAVCIDDLQWLDAQTAGVVTFALRRLPETGVRVVAGLRTEPGVSPPELVGRLAGALPLVRHVVEPTGETGLNQVLRAHLGADVPRWVVRSAVRHAGGNPLFALEVARTLLVDPAQADPFDPDALAVPDSLFDVVGRHVAQLPESTRSALAAAAAIRRPTLRQLRRLGSLDDLAAAERGGIVTVRNHEVRFNHPMYAAVAYQQLSAIERSSLHARIADVVDGAEERARHLAVAAEEPDEDVAAALDVARDHAVKRGALEAAAEASRLAVGATPAGSAKLADRRVQFGFLLFRLGDVELARHELERALDGATEPLVRGRVLYTLGHLVNATEGPPRGTPLYLEALALAKDDPELAGDIHMDLAANYSDDWERALEHARTAVQLVEAAPDPDPARVARALVAETAARFYTGGGADLELCRRAIELQGGDSSLPVADRAVSVLFYLQLWIDDFAGARATMDQAYQIAIDEGDESARWYVLANRAKLEVRAGRWAEAERLIDECAAITDASGNPHLDMKIAIEQAWLAAYRGDLDTAVEIADRDIEHGLRTSNPLAEQRGRGLRGWCALARGDAEAAAQDLDRYMALFESNHAGEPALRQLAGDHVEALVQCGRLGDAERALGQLVEPAERLGRIALVAAAVRAEALVRAEHGDGEAAVAAAARSLALYERVERRFERARALLVMGQVQRRSRQRALARAALSEALAEFEALGARGFARHARIELARVGGRGTSPIALTETERQIAEHAARGMRSAEIGRTMFMSTKTVSGNLTRIYQKLGVRNRAELAARLLPPSTDLPD